MNIEIQARGTIRELIAPEGYFLTQAAQEIPDRIFCTRRMLLADEQAADWRPATPREKADYEAEMAWRYTSGAADEVPDSRSEADNSNPAL